MILTEIKNLALAAAIAFALGGIGGYYTRAQFEKADQLEAVVEGQHQTADGIKESLEKSREIDMATTESTKQVQTIAKVVVQRLQKKESTDEARTLSACSSVIDVFTVSLLNAARNGETIDPARFSDDEGKTPAGIGLPELLESDLEVVSLYRELAIKHDALVDYVSSQIDQQANQ